MKLSHMQLEAEQTETERQEKKPLLMEKDYCFYTSASNRPCSPRGREDQLGCRAALGPAVKAEIHLSVE